MQGIERSFGTGHRNRPAYTGVHESAESPIARGTERILIQEGVEIHVLTLGWDQGHQGIVGRSVQG